MFFAQVWRGWKLGARVVSQDQNFPPKLIYYSLKKLEQFILQLLATLMMAFNDYFGYDRQKGNNIFSRKSKRTEFSLQKLADLSDSKSKKKQLVIPLIKNDIIKSNSPARFNRLSLKRSPFKLTEKKQTIHHEYGHKQKSNSKRGERINHTYQRYFSEDCKTKKIVVEKRKDTLIRQYLQRKKQEKNFQNRLENKINQTSKSQQNLLKHQEKSEYAYVERKEVQAKFEYPQKDKIHFKMPRENKDLTKPMEIEKISMESDSLFNQEEEDCVLEENREEDYDLDDDNYQIRQSFSQHQKVKASFDSDINVKNSYKVKINEKRLQETPKSQTLFKFDIHMKVVGRLLQFICQTNQFHQQKSQIFLRQNFLLKRMYYAEIHKVIVLLRGEQIPAHFALGRMKISKEQLQLCLRQNPYEIDLRVSKLIEEIKELKEMLQEESQSLIERSPNDPYLHIENDNFEPELVNELYEEINQISDKVTGRMTVPNKGALEERRYTIMNVIFLIGELCGFNEQVEVQLVGNGYVKYYEDNRELLEDIITSFQEMPL